MNDSEVRNNSIKQRKILFKKTKKQKKYTVVIL